MEQLGIDVKLLLAQIVNFGLVAFLLYRVLFKKVLDMLNKRKSEIDEGLKLSDKMKDEYDALEKKKEKYMDSTRKDAQVLLADSKKKAKEEEKQIIEAAHKQAEAILVKARTESKNFKTEVENEVRSKALELASAIVKKLIPEFLSTNEQKKLLESKLKAIKI